MPQPHQIRAESATHTTAHGNARSLTHWVRPEMEPTTSCFLVEFVSTAPQQELPSILFFFFFGCPMAYRVLRPGIRSEFQIWPKPQLRQHQILNPQCQAGDWICIPALPRCHWYRGAIGRTLIYSIPFMAFNNPIVFFFWPHPQNHMEVLGPVSYTSAMTTLDP